MKMHITLEVHEQKGIYCLLSIDRAEFVAPATFIDVINM